MEQPRRVLGWISIGSKNFRFQISELDGKYGKYELGLRAVICD